MSHQASAPASAEVYKAGSIYKAKMYNGKVFTHSTDASMVINDALANLPNGGRFFGGRVFIYAGDYTCLTMIDMTETTRGFDGAELVGEGAGTSLLFTPSSAITAGIKTQMNFGALKDLHLYGNANVPKIVHNQSTLSAAGGKYYMNFERLLFSGAPANTGAGYWAPNDGNPTAGQIGIYIEGDTSGAGKPSFFYNYRAVHFRGLDIGAHLFGEMATSAMVEGCTGFHNNTVFKVSGGQNHFQNCWFQGLSSVGNWGIYLLGENGGSGSRTFAFNVHAELHKAGEKCAAVYISPGSANNRFYGVRNDYDDGWQWFSVLDETDVGNDMTQQVFAELEFPAYMTRWRTGNWLAGSQVAANAGGCLAGNVLDPSSSGLVPEGVNAYMRRFQTTTSTGNITHCRFSHAGNATAAPICDFEEYPRLWARWQFRTISPGRFFLGWTTNTAVPTSTTDPLANLKGAGLWLDTAVSANLKAICNNGTASSTMTDLGVTSSGNTSMARITVNSTGTNTVQVIYAVDTTYRYANLTTNTPLTDPCTWVMYAENRGTTPAKGFDLADIYMEYRS